MLCLQEISRRQLIENLFRSVKKESSPRLGQSSVLHASAHLQFQKKEPKLTACQLYVPVVWFEIDPQFSRKDVLTQPKCFNEKHAKSSTFCIDEGKLHMIVEDSFYLINAKMSQHFKCTFPAILRVISKISEKSATFFDR